MNSTESNDDPVRKSRRLRWFVLLYALGVLLWLSLEDTDVVRVVIVGLIGMLLLAHSEWRRARRVSALRALLIGAGIGVGTAISAALLMVWKTGMHAHPFPDYPPALILSVIERAPVWALAGALSALAFKMLFSKDEVKS